MKHTTIQEYIMTGGPPAEMPTIKTPAKALQLFEKDVNQHWKWSDAGRMFLPGDNTESKSDHAQQTEGALELCLCQYHASIARYHSICPYLAHSPNPPASHPLPQSHQSRCHHTLTLVMPWLFFLEVSPLLALTVLWDNTQQAIDDR
jgi:hypothetical protein